MKRLAAVAIGILLLSTAALAQVGTVVDQVIAWANTDVILKSELEKAYSDLRADIADQGLKGVQADQAFTDRSKDSLRSLIDQALVLQVAKEQNINGDIQVVKRMDEMRQQRKLPTMEALETEIVRQGFDVEEVKENIRAQYLVDQVFQHEVYSRVTITNEELRTYYDAHTKDFDRPEGERLQEIAVSTGGLSASAVADQRKKVEEALAAVKNGEDFGDVARKYSETDTAEAGGELGFFPKGQLRKEFEDAIGSLEKNQLSDIITTSDGLYILKVADRHKGGVLPFELATREIQNQIWQQRVPSKIREYLTQLRAEGFIRLADGYVDTGAAPTTSTAANQQK